MPDWRAAYEEWVTGLDTEPPLDGAYFSGWQAGHAERDALREQLVHLGAAYETRLNDWHALRAENERLKAFQGAYREAEAENERLRAIADEWRHWHVCTHTNPCWSGEPKQA